MADLTISQLKELLHYDPETGVWIWKVQQGRQPRGSVAGSVRTHGYRAIISRGRGYYAHRLAFLYMTGNWPVDQVDHINGVRDDNRWTNLRPATNSQNGQNRGATANSKSGIKGVWQAKGRWKAQITKKGRRFCLGSFGTSEEAREAYCKAATNLHGEFSE